MKFFENVPVEYFEVNWLDYDLELIGAKVGDPKHQTPFEYLAVLFALSVWGGPCRAEGIALLWDNISALQCAISMKGRGGMNHNISR